MNKEYLDTLAAEEKALEAKLFSTPSDDKTKTEEATSAAVEQKEAHVGQNELVTQTAPPATDGQQNATREPQENWELRYKNLRASREQKLVDTKRQLTAALETVQVLQRRNDELKAELIKLQQSVDPLDKVFSQEVVEALGDDTVKAIKDSVKASTEAATGSLKEQLEQQKERERKQQEAQLATAKQDEYNTFISRLGNVVPEWQAINADPEFFTFCHNSYDIDGRLIAESFREAEEARDAVTIARFMLQFKSRQTAQPKEKVDNLAEHVAPTGQAASQSTTTKQPEIMTKAEIDKFYSDLSKGRLRGRQGYVDEMEAKIEKAIMEGRVR